MERLKGKKNSSKKKLGRRNESLQKQGKGGTGMEGKGTKRNRWSRKKLTKEKKIIRES